MKLIPLILGMALLVPASGFSDQTDARLDALFDTLKTSEISGELQEAEVNIWAIWFESGRDEIDRLMEVCTTSCCVVPAARRTRRT